MKENSALVIGDLHVQMSNLEDTNKIFKIIQESAINLNPQSIIFTGDIYHTHAVLRQEIIDTVQYCFSYLKSGVPSDTKIYIIVGNHDGYSPTSTKINAVRQTLTNYAHIVDDISGSIESNSGYFLVGYKHKEEDFLNDIKNAGDRIIICHQTFNGAKYDNGFYAPDGFDLSKVKQKIISGHIHSEQSFGNVVYVGTPRPVNFGEAVDLRDENALDNRKSISYFYTECGALFRDKIYTDEKVKNYYKMSIQEGEILDKDQIRSLIRGVDSEIRITVSGSQDWYDKIFSEYSDICSKVKFVPIIVKHLESQLKEIDGNFSVEKSLRQYVYDIYNDSEENKEKVWTTLQKIMQLT